MKPVRHSGPFLRNANLFESRILWTDPFIDHFIDHFIDRFQDEIFAPQTRENIQAQIVS